MGDIIKIDFKNKKVNDNKKKARKFNDAGKNFFEDIMRKNKENEERMKKDRTTHNKKTKREYRLDR